MRIENMSAFIEALPITDPHESVLLTEAAPSVDINNLPEGIVSGSTMIGFEPDLSTELRKSVALCLTAAQKVAKADSVAASPDLWVERHDMVLRGLNWVSTGGGTVFTERDVSNMAVHKAIIPFLTAAFGTAATATSLIITAIEQMQQMNANAPWITLFERESRRFDVSEYRFATVGLSNGIVVLRLAAARFIAQQERVQVLFFKRNDLQVSFNLASRVLTANTDLLEEMNESLARKLLGHTNDFVEELDFG